MPFPMPPVPTPGFLYTCRLTPDGVFTFDAPAADTERVYELSPQDMGRMLTEGRLPFLPADSTALWDSIHKSAGELAPWNGDFEVRGQRTGRESWVRIHAMPRRDPDGSVNWTGLIIDITDLKSAERELRKAYQELAFHVENTPLAVIEWDGEFKVSRWNEQAERVFGWTASEVTGKGPFDWVFIHPDDVPVCQRLMGRLVSGEEPRNVTVNRNLTKAGNVVWCEWHNSVRLDDNGRMASLLSLALDITDRHNAAEALARSEARMRSALDSAKMLGWDLDLVANRWETTANFCDFHGLPVGPDYSDPENAIAAVHPDDVPSVLEGRRRAIERNEPMRYEFRGRVPTPSGFPRWFSTRGQVLRDTNGNAVRLVAVTTDITERKRAEAERATLDKQLLDAQKWESLGVLSGGVAHDFNNILTVVLGNAGLARKGLPPLSPASGYLEQIEEACRRAADLCRQLLAYTGREHAATATTADLNQLIRASAALLAVPTSKSAGVRFDLADSLPAVRADPAQVRQVLMNLVMNAAEAVGDDGGEVLVETRLFEVPVGPLGGYHLTPIPGRYVRLVVSDTGPGIPPLVQARMFDPFFTTKFAGRGLGLSAVLGIMRTYGGGIRIRTTPEHGTTVEVLWPAVAEARPVSAIPGHNTAGLALVVDDEMYVREVTASTLEELGYEPLLAGDGPTAIQLFRLYREGIRIAVIDMVMPGMSGDQLLEELRAIEPNLPAVIVSGFTDRHVIRAGTRTEFLQKPFHPEELLAVVARLLALA